MNYTYERVRYCGVLVYFALLKILSVLWLTSLTITSLITGIMVMDTFLTSGYELKNNCLRSASHMGLTNVFFSLAMKRPFKRANMIAERKLTFEQKDGVKI